MPENSYSSLQVELIQPHSVRKPLIEALEKELQGKRVVTFFTSFVHPVMIDDSDVVMLEETLQNIDLSKGLMLVINSPGGSGLAAERIIRVCRSYSNNNFEVLVPQQAKSAATMVCLGAKKIWMSPVSELGPIDPQFTFNGKPTSVHSVISSYDKLFEEALKLSPDQRIELFLQQISAYDAAEIAALRLAQELSEDIAINSLLNGMMKNRVSGKDEEAIKKIKEKLKNELAILLSAEQTKSHGRPIHVEKAKECGLTVKEVKLESSLWKALWSLYIRTDYIIRQKSAKVVESSETSYQMALPQ